MVEHRCLLQSGVKNQHVVEKQDMAAVAGLSNLHCDSGVPVAFRSTKPNGNLVPPMPSGRINPVVGRRELPRRRVNPDKGGR